MADPLAFDEERSRAVDTLYATDDVVGQRRATLEALDLQPGERVLDIGCGPGYLAAEMAELVGPEGFVQGIDPSPHMLAIAARRALRAIRAFNLTHMNRGRNAYQASHCYSLADHMLEGGPGGSPSGDLQFGPG